LAALVAPHADRFLPLYAINPAFPGWDADLDRCVRDLGLAAGRGGLRLYPNYHQFALDGPEAAALLERAVRLDVPVAVSVRLEDERTHHWLVKVPAVSTETLSAAVAAHPDVRWIVCGLHAPEIRGLWQALESNGAAGRARLLFDLSLVQGPIDECALLVRTVGADRLAFGTNLPLTVAESPALALAYAGLAPETKAQIAAGNATRLFGLAE
jgi:predicted TIM-barrel fold metal-dependent hydrolase